MAFKLAEAFVELSLKGDKAVASSMDDIIRKAKEAGGVIDRTTSKLKVYQDALKNSGGSGATFGAMLDTVAKKLNIVAVGIGSAIALMVQLDRMAVSKQSFGDVIDDWTRKLIGFKSRAQEAESAAQAVAGAVQSQQGMTRDFMRALLPQRTAAQAGQSGELTGEQQGQIDARLDQVNRTRQALDAQINEIKSKSRSGIFSGLEQHGIIDSSSADRVLASLRQQKDALGAMITQADILKGHWIDQNKLAAEQERINQKQAAEEKERAMRAQNEEVWTKRMTEHLQKQAEVREKGRDEGRGIFEATRSPAERAMADIAKAQAAMQRGDIDMDTFKRRAGMLAAGLSPEGGRSTASRMMGAEEFASFAQGGAGGTEKKIEANTKKTVDILQEFAQRGVLLRGQVKSTMGR